MYGKPFGEKKGLPDNCFPILPRGESLISHLSRNSNSSGKHEPDGSPGQPANHPGGVERMVETVNASAFPGPNPPIDSSHHHAGTQKESDNCDCCTLNPRSPNGWSEGTQKEKVAFFVVDGTIRSTRNRSYSRPEDRDCLTGRWLHKWSQLRRRSAFSLLRLP
jgi:hypothetical protein